jgi:hypothetical protein
MNQRLIDELSAEGAHERALIQAEQGARAWGLQQNRREQGRAPGDSSPPPPAPHTPVLFGREAQDAHELWEVEQQARQWAQRQNERDAWRGR